MRIRFPLPYFAPDGGAAGGGAPAAGADSSAGASGADTAAGGGADSLAGAGNDDDDDSLFSAVNDKPTTDANGKPVKPDWLADQFWNAEKGEADLAGLAKSQRDLRAMISRGEHKPPAAADGYQVPTVEGVEDPLALMGGKDDPLWGEVRTAAHANGVSQAQMAAILAPVLAAAAKKTAEGGGGAPADPAAIAAERAEAKRAELAKLGPNGEAVVRQTGEWLAGLVNRGIFTKEEAKGLRGISTAEGVRALAKLREMAGGQAIPLDALSDDGDMTQGDAEKLMADGFATGDQAKVEKAKKALLGLEKRGLLQPPNRRR